MADLKVFLLGGLEISAGRGEAGASLFEGYLFGLAVGLRLAESRNGGAR